MSCDSGGYCLRVKGEEQTEIISSSDTVVDEFPYASTAQRYILQVQISYHARFEVLASVFNIRVVRDMTRCRLVHGNRCLGLAAASIFRVVQEQ